MELTRRNFMGTLILLTSGKVAYDLCSDLYKKSVVKDIYEELPRHIHFSETKLKYEKDGKVQDLTNSGFGVVVDGHYLTLAHLVRKDNMVMRTPFGMMYVPNGELKEAETRLKEFGNPRLEELLCDTSKDEAVYKLPKGVDVPSFPAKPRTQIRLGEGVVILGNPYIAGQHYRRGYISRLSGNNKIPNNETYFGIDETTHGGDSGTPVVGLDYSLLGLTAISAGADCGYAKKIGRLTKHLG